VYSIFHLNFESLRLSSSNGRISKRSMQQ
jgi:hypothetical protein